MFSLRFRRAERTNGEHPVVLAARAYSGYTARDSGTASGNIFLAGTGLSGGFQWDGAFINRVLQDAGMNGAPDYSNTVSALSFHVTERDVRSGRRARPRPGDIVFFNFPSASATVSFDPPHIGVVTETARWKEDGVFRCVEAQINSGLPRASTEHNGVFERTRYATDVLAFVRIPRRAKRNRRQTADATVSETVHAVRTVRPGYITACAPGPKTARTRGKGVKPEHREATVALQKALAAEPGVRLQQVERGVFDMKTRAALACFQRVHGVPPENCTGAPDVLTLNLLVQAASATGEEFAQYTVEP